MIPACPVCLEPMLRPHGLPCMHNVCSSCVPLLAAKPGKAMACPTCRAYTCRPYVPNYGLIEAYEHIALLCAPAQRPPKTPWYRRLRQQCRK